MQQIRIIVCLLLYKQSTNKALIIILHNLLICMTDLLQNSNKQVLKEYRNAQFIDKILLMMKVFMQKLRNIPIMRDGLKMEKKCGFIIQNRLNRKSCQSTSELLT